MTGAQQHVSARRFSCDTGCRVYAFRDGLRKWCFMKRTGLLGLVILLLVAGASLAQEDGDASTLLLYSTVERMLSGDMANAVEVETVEDDLSVFPDTWVVLGLGTTNQPMRNGELMPDGTVADVDFWWADPSSDAHNAIVDIAPDAGATDPTPEASVDPDPEFPFLGLAVADPDDALIVRAENVDNIHVWLQDVLEAEGVTLAGLELEGAFGPVRTSVAYNIPLTGLDLSGGYVGDDYFRFGEYEPATWHLNGLYAADPEMQPIVSTAGNAVHLHGYQPETMIGGHIASAEAVDVTVTIYPLEVVQQEMNEPLQARG